MTAKPLASGLFPALLKHWRTQRGLSQLDLAIAADVSSRHLSFLETGRSAPTQQMVLQLAATLDVSLRHTNTMLRAADLDPVYADRPLSEGLPGPLAQAVELMKKQQEPYPLIVLDRHYDVLDLNSAAMTLLGSLLPSTEGGAALNLVRATFDPAAAQSLIANFDQVGRDLLWRLQREVLADPDDQGLRDLLEEVLDLGTVPEGWRAVNLGEASDPSLVLHLTVGAQVLRFVTLVTTFQAPQNVAADEIRIESWFPADPETERALAALAP